MRLLLDTHALIWMHHEPSRLPERARVALDADTNEVILSAVCAWEIAIRTSAGKLRVDLADIVRASRSARLLELPVTVRHAQRLQSIEGHHSDPFDRMLVAQALEEGCSIVTGDETFRSYDVPIVWD